VAAFFFAAKSLIRFESRFVSLAEINARLLLQGRKHSSSIGFVSLYVIVLKSILAAGLERLSGRNPGIYLLFGLTLFFLAAGRDLDAVVLVFALAVDRASLLLGRDWGKTNSHSAMRTRLPENSTPSVSSRMR